MPRRALPHRNSLRRALYALVAALAVGGCATPPGPVVEPIVQPERGPVLAKDDDVTIVIAGPADTADTLAQRYLGDARKAWWIAEANSEIRPGQVVVVPSRIHNRIGVYGDGYQAVPILCYHRFGAKASKLTVTPAAFAAQMQYLAKNGYQVLPMARLDEFLAGRAPLPRKSLPLPGRFCPDAVRFLNSVPQLPNSAASGTKLCTTAKKPPASIPVTRRQRRAWLHFTPGCAVIAMDRK